MKMVVIGIVDKMWPDQWNRMRFLGLFMQYYRIVEVANIADS